MIPITIGFSSGLLIILLFSILKLLDKNIVYGLILSGIGFLYVGFVWTDLQALVVNAIQAVLFLFLAYYGVRKEVHILALGYFLFYTLYEIVLTFTRFPVFYNWHKRVYF